MWGSLAVLFLTILMGFSAVEATSFKETTSLRVGASPTPHTEILEYIKPQLAKEGITLEIVKFDDYILPNKSLAEKDIDANYFQHEPFYNLAVSENDYQFANQGPIHIELMGLYSKRIKTISELEMGATVMVSNSESDWGRVITILETAGLVKVAKGVELATATFDDIVENPLKLKFIHTVNPELLTQAYQNDEADLVAINANFASTIQLSPTVDSVLVEKEKSPYANILVSRKDNRHDEAIKVLVKALHSKKTQSWIKKEWGGKIQPVNGMIK
ncbi:MetQ/NlpA family ABC transporter substrate-binding protein [Vagococcus intermedius]|uniref:Lipoprotein n=1 Tax=Vagococcus intermedius TaxID=2991418 RepID=A0AAF0I8F5_9ENTE|nr:MetQ/NlpA family ABC transporter substrate-binding protein [Vagococcus intermedius]WEG74340.1 MetQ/NlpA family ABC transporter substrate-binding protein [Vagococcus intermedius]WEG76422.1 MetQ/NlpA family ABC transporter substrate-binding protein [Vagococcus intermedius]